MIGDNLTGCQIGIEGLHPHPNLPPSRGKGIIQRFLEAKGTHSEDSYVSPRVSLRAVSNSVRVTKPSKRWSARPSSSRM